MKDTNNIKALQIWNKTFKRLLNYLNNTRFWFSFVPDKARIPGIKHCAVSEAHHALIALYLQCIHGPSERLYLRRNCQINSQYNRTSRLNLDDPLIMWNVTKHRAVTHAPVSKRRFAKKGKVHGYRYGSHVHSCPRLVGRHHQALPSAPRVNSSFSRTV